MMKNLSKLLLGAMLCLSLTAHGATPDNDKQIYKRVDALMKKMTLQEKIGQLQQLTTSKGAITGPEGEKINTEEFIRRGWCGSMLNAKTSKDIAYYQNIAINESRLGIPILFGYDIIHGCRIIFPENLGMSSSWDMEAI
ncbi:MAG: glycosyl hydrolase, partial [Alistipes sp.]|nr:glycosyl hydrolase [Alistipes sp.]